MPETVVYSVGLVTASVCTDGTLEDAIDQANIESPTSTGWGLSPDVFLGSESNTIPCDRNPETHTHYLLSC